jgi:hypothetical protein
MNSYINGIEVLSHQTLTPVQCGFIYLHFQIVLSYQTSTPLSSLYAMVSTTPVLVKQNP